MNGKTLKFLKSNLLPFHKGIDNLKKRWNEMNIHEREVAKKRLIIEKQKRVNVPRAIPQATNIHNGWMGVSNA